MKKIMLCCAAGMSTSLLVTKMEQSAKDQQIEAEIWAVPVEEAKDKAIEADVILLGPQIRYMVNQVKKVASEHGIQAEVINAMDYGMINGEAVLKQALKLIR
ncbi:PTS sugar transporter subunit IIB [Virgibacillus halophilus]|uniref:PTS sugar transporter subunit IIB n=1 Tax=Tigheibacillus halophilus TaxID=361280 RepID=A0ABU5C3H1_9BACI|nr:PTS sugar transporter subunit IIB [Virgibacillus halophilus]